MIFMFYLCFQERGETDVLKGDKRRKYIDFIDILLEARVSSVLILYFAFVFFRMKMAVD